MLHNSFGRCQHPDSRGFELQQYYRTPQVNLEELCIWCPRDFRLLPRKPGSAEPVLPAYLIAELFQQVLSLTEHKNFFTQLFFA